MIFQPTSGLSATSSPAPAGTAVFVNYTPSPEAQYPTAINQAYAATKWVAENGNKINVDGKTLAIVGNSVGGNMTAVVALMAKSKGGPKLKCQILFWPVTNANLETGSYNEYTDGYFLSKGMMKWFWDAYTTDPEKRKEITCSPLLASTEELTGLPSAMVQTAGNDVLRDEGEAYARKLDAAGVDVTAVRYEGLIHDYGMLNALSQVPAVRDALHQAADMLKKHLIAHRSHPRDRGSVGSMTAAQHAVFASRRARRSISATATK